MAFALRFLVVTAITTGILAIPGIGPASQAGPLFGWFQGLWPKQPGPEDPHLYPEGSLLYDVWTCKGETELGWIGVTQQFTDHDPYVVVVVRSEFPEQNRMGISVGVELHAPRHKMIIASDRVILRRDQDIAFFYHPLDMARLGGWGEYKAVITIDGIPRKEIAFQLDREEDLRRQAEEQQLRKEAEAVFTGGSSEARGLLGEPDSSPGKNEPGEVDPVAEAARSTPQLEVRDPKDWYRTRFENEEGAIIMFPKKARRTWQENVQRDLNYRIRYYIFL
ncbi:MAG: hypothetical protein GHCLOJNM_00863 [bacterium]|nr:hypothetical protein [bacterium]